MCLRPYKIIVMLIFQIYETLFVRLYNCCNTLSFFMSNLLLNHHLVEPQHLFFYTIDGSAIFESFTTFKTDVVFI